MSFKILIYLLINCDIVKVFSMNQPTNKKDITLDQIIFGCYQILFEVSKKYGSEKKESQILERN